MLLRALLLFLFFLFLARAVWRLLEGVAEKVATLDDPGGPAAPVTPGRG